MRNPCANSLLWPRKQRTYGTNQPLLRILFFRLQTPRRALFSGLFRHFSRFSIFPVRLQMAKGSLLCETKPICPGCHQQPGPCKRCGRQSYETKPTSAFGPPRVPRSHGLWVPPSSGHPESGLAVSSLLRRRFAQSGSKPEMEIAVFHKFFAGRHGCAVCSRVNPVGTPHVPRGRGTRSPHLRPPPGLGYTLSP